MSVTDIVIVVGCLAGGYFVGGVPFGAMIAWGYGVDITTQGSGATGATNVLRTLGWRPALAVVVLDIAKGALPVAASLCLTLTWATWARDLLGLSVGVIAMLGHSYSPFLRMHGGKGIATGGGAVIVLMPWAAAVLLPAFAIYVAASRIVSLASIAIALLFPLEVWLIYPERPVLLVFACLAVPLVLWRHRSNMGRLLRGEEPRIAMGSIPAGGASRREGKGPA